MGTSILIFFPTKIIFKKFVQSWAENRRSKILVTREWFFQVFSRGQFFSSGKGEEKEGPREGKGESYYITNIYWFTVFTNLPNND